MLRNLFSQTVSVSRESATLTNKELTDGWATVHGALKCRVEPLPAREKDSILGRIARARYKLTWGTELVLEGDRVTWSSKKFIVHEVTDDTARTRIRYHTCILEEADL